MVDKIPEVYTLLTTHSPTIPLKLTETGQNGEIMIISTTNTTTTLTACNGLKIENMTQRVSVIATVTDHGDPTVGIFPQSWRVECPFLLDEDEYVQDGFRKDLIVAFAPFADGRVTVDFDYELKQELL